MLKGNKDKQAVLTYMIENSRNGVFSGTMSKIAKHLGVKHPSSVRNYIMQLIEDGEIEYKTPPQRGKSVGSYKILHKESSDRQFDGQLIIEFRGEKIVLQYIDGYGYCISKKQLAKVTDDYVEFIDYKVGRNKEQFTPHMAILQEEQYFDRIAVMLYLNKLDLADTSENKRANLNNFQLTMAEHMCDMVLKGRVKLDDKGKATIEHNLSALCELTEEQIKDFVSDIEDQFSKIMSSQVEYNVELTEDMRKVQNQLNMAIEDRNRWLGEANRLKVGN